MAFKKYDKVYVTANSTSYGGRYGGAVGSVVYVNSENGKIGVNLKSFVNQNSAHGWFYFNRNELRPTCDEQGPCISPFTIKKVYFNDPVTVILWADGTKTIVRCGEDDIYDPEKGLAIAISKKALGNKGKYYNTFKKHLPEEVEVDDPAIREFFNNLASLFILK